jgi:hypothetical protein
VKKEKEAKKAGYEMINDPRDYKRRNKWYHLSYCTVWSSNIHHHRLERIQYKIPNSDVSPQSWIPLSMSLPISEIPRHPPARHTSFYLALIFCVLPVWSIPILSWSFVLYELTSRGSLALSWHRKALFTYALAEVFRPLHHCLSLDLTITHCPLLPLGPVFSTSLLSLQICQWPLPGFSRES